jgi:chromosome segregation ATPase
MFTSALLWTLTVAVSSAVPFGRPEFAPLQPPDAPQEEEANSRWKEIKKELAEIASKQRETAKLRKQSKEGSDALLETLQTRLNRLKKELNAGPPPKSLPDEIAAYERDIRRTRASQKETEEALSLMESMYLKRAAKLREELHSLDK